MTEYLMQLMLSSGIQITNMTVMMMDFLIKQKINVEQIKIILILMEMELQMQKTNYHQIQIIQKIVILTDFLMSWILMMIIGIVMVMGQRMDMMLTLWTLQKNGIVMVMVYRMKMNGSSGQTHVSQTLMETEQMTKKINILELFITNTTLMVMVYRMPQRF